MTEISDVIPLINRRHGTSWSLLERLPGGYLQGAYEIRGPDGERGVLKWHATGLPTSQLLAAARSVERLHPSGWPTARWLAHGALPEGGAYIVEEFVDGVVPTRLAGSGLQQLLSANALQADMHPDTKQDWSSYTHRVVFEGEADLVARMRARRVTADLLTRLELLTADARSLSLPTTDLVHGDFVLRNMLVNDGSLRVIDTAHVGKGTRDPRRIESECLSIIGRPALRVCLVGRMLHYLVFGDGWQDYDPTVLVATCGSFIERYEG